MKVLINDGEISEDQLERIIQIVMNLSWFLLECFFFTELTVVGTMRKISDGLMELSGNPGFCPFKQIFYCKRKYYF